MNSKSSPGDKLLAEPVDFSSGHGGPLLPLHGRACLSDDALQLLMRRIIASRPGDAPGYRRLEQPNSLQKRTTGIVSA